MPSPPSRSRNWCFTLNNYSATHEADLARLVQEGRLVYVYYGREIAPSTGTPHLQGLAVYKNPVLAGAVRKDIPGHCEAMRGRLDQAEAYNSKSGDIVELGTRPKTAVEKGASTKDRWTNIIALAESGEKDQLKSLYPQEYVRYSKQLDALHQYDISDLDHGTQHLWYYGSSGTGKSHEARKSGSFYLKKRNKWWDGYRGERVVILEEWSPDNRSTAQELKIWADRYSFPAEIKGGCIVIRPKLIIVTSNYSIDECFDEKDLAPMHRRFKSVHFKNIYTGASP